MSKILVPDYFEDFHCKCGDCRNPCCDGWGINVDKHEYFSLIGLECSKKLRHRLDDAFVLSNPATDDAYASIRPNYLEQCPMLDDDGLCLLQKEKGETPMPLICRVYPRAVKRYGSHHEVCMSCSCEETVELLMRSTAPLSLHEADYPLSFDGLFVYDENPEKDSIRHSMIAVMSNSHIPIAERIGVIGNFVCGKEEKPSGSRTDALKAIVKFLALLCKGSESIRVYGEGALEYLSSPDDVELLRRFDAAEEHLYSVIPEVEAYAGKIISNHMLYESFPFVPDCESPDTAFAAFCSALALLKLLCVCGMAKSESLSDFADILASANRFTEHSNFYRVCSRLSHPDGMEVYAKFSPIISRAK